jgi:hypothetical protein
VSSRTGSPDAASDESRPGSGPSLEDRAVPSKPPAEAPAGHSTSAASTPAKPSAPAKSSSPAKTAPALKRGGVVPNKASEDDPRAWGDSESDNDHDAWLKEQKPPHWG